MQRLIARSIYYSSMKTRLTCDTYDEKHEQQINVKFLVKLKKSSDRVLHVVEMTILYLVRVFASGINGFLKAERAPTMTNVQVDLSQRYNQSSKSMKLCAEIVV